MLWKTVQSRTSNKCNTANILILTERDMAMTNENLITDTFNFSKLVAKNMCFHLTMLIN